MPRADTGCPVNPDFDPLGAAYLADPFAIFEQVPARHRPIFFAPRLGYYVVTGYAEVDHVLLGLVTRFPDLQLEGD